MKLRRRDPHQVFLAQSYYTLKHDGSDQGLKKFRTMASLNTLESLSIRKVQNTTQTQPNRTRTIQNKQSRLKKMNKKYQSSKLITATNDIINVNSFKHLTAVHYMDTNQIKWAFGLRNHQQLKSKRSVSQVPSTYYKTTESSKIHHETTDMPSHINFNSFMHLTKQGQHPSMGLLKFQTTLRQSELIRKKSPQLIQKQKSFDTIPMKDRHDYPKLLNSQSLKKKIINPQEDLKTAFDGNHNYPSYTNRIIKQRNYNNIRQQLKNPPRSKINLPSLGWQTNLRFYEDLQRSKQNQLQQKSIVKKI